MFEFFITGHKGFETQLFHEVRDILATRGDIKSQLKKVYGGLQIQGELPIAYLICLHSRLANRVYLVLDRFKAENEEALYQGVYRQEWSKHLSPRHSMLVSTSLSRSNITHSHFAALKIKDAVVDYFRNQFSGRPQIAKQRPDVHIHVNIHQNRATLNLDLAGESLHRRGYRLQHSGAPLKENLAAAMLFAAGWNEKSGQHHSLYDPMCGSGTFAIEAAMMASSLAPGLDRDYFGFSGWLQHDKASWQQLIDQAEQAINLEIDCEIHAHDIDPKSIDIARENASRAGVEELIQFQQQDFLQVEADNFKQNPLIIFNPPYGERLEVSDGLANLYTSMGRVLRNIAANHPETRVSIISANPDLLHRLRLHQDHKKNVNNGPLKCVVANFSFPEKLEPAEPKPAQADSKLSTKINLPEIDGLINRLKKNDRHISKWAKRNRVGCYRIYDADLPEFSFALDRYTSSINAQQHWYLLQEYQAPKNIDPDKAAQRIQAAEQAVKNLFGLEEAQLFSKLRQRQRGNQQYEKQDQKQEFFQVAENGAEILVNFKDYLDTGLFLDHRVTREILRNQLKDKTLLNLFCYTAVVSIQAALGGARRITSVDMSNTYIHWARENFAANNLSDDKKYQFLTEDCLTLLKYPHKFPIDKSYDFIFLDPPSFSNSKKMQDTLDIQRDHGELIHQAMKLLARDGMLFFSTNKKGFKLNSEIAAQYQVEDITAKTIPEDFKRRPKIHQCWTIRYHAKG